VQAEISSPRGLLEICRKLGGFTRGVLVPIRRNESTDAPHQIPTPEDAPDGSITLMVSQLANRKMISLCYQHLHPRSIYRILRRLQSHSDRFQTSNQNQGGILLRWSPAHGRFATKRSRLWGDGSGGAPTYQSLSMTFVDGPRCGRRTTASSNAAIFNIGSGEGHTCASGTIIEGPAGKN